MYYLESALEELESSTTSSDRKSAAQSHLHNIQKSITLSELDNYLHDEGSGQATAFALYTIAARPKDFVELLPKLLALFQKLSPHHSADSLLLKAYADSISAVILSLKRDDPWMAMVVDLLKQRSGKEFPLLECLSSKIHRLIHNDKREQARLHWLRTAIKGVIPDLMSHVDAANLESSVSALKEYVLIADATEMEFILRTLFSAVATGKEYLLIDVLNGCAESCSLNKLINWYLIVLNDATLDLTLQPVLAMFQEKMIEFCKLSERTHICNLALNYLSKSSPPSPSPHFELEMTVGFWEELATDLTDSDSITQSDQEVFKRLLEVAFSTNISLESRKNLAQLCYKAIGQELIHYLINSYTTFKEGIFIDILDCLGEEYIGPAEPITKFIESLVDSGLCLKLSTSFHNSLSQHVGFGKSMCSLAVSLLHQTDSPLATKSILDGLVLYAKDATVDQIFSCLNVLLNFSDDAVDERLKRFLLSACKEKDLHVCNQVMNVLCLNCSSFERLSMIEGLMAHPGFHFELHACIGFGNLLNQCIVNLLNVDQRIGEKCVQFVVCAISKIAAVDAQLCSSLLSDIKSQLDSSIIIPIFTSAEQVTHFEDSILVMQKYSNSQVNLDDIIKLHASVCGTNYEAYMEYGIEHVVKVIHHSLARLQEPLSKCDLMTYLNYFTLLLLNHQKEAHKNWSKLLFSAIKVDFIDALLLASYKYDHEMIEMVARFLYNLVSECPVQFKEYLGTTLRFKPQLSWMLQHYSLKEFCILFKRIFQ